MEDFAGADGRFWRCKGSLPDPKKEGGSQNYLSIYGYKLNKAVDFSLKIRYFTVSKTQPIHR